LGFAPKDSDPVLGCTFCCECNLCSYYACPEGLDPKQACADNKRRAAVAKQRYENPPLLANRADLMMANRKTPTQRLMAKIGLAKYTNKAPLIDKTFDVQRLTIPLKQHIGATCVPVVSVGAAVRKGQAVAKRPMQKNKPALGADIHSPIDGTVLQIFDEQCILIAKN
jgi:Na+-translocating ferredoxin:NAD+ oxidoreductase RnfC subunit